MGLWNSMRNVSLERKITVGVIFGMAFLMAVVAVIVAINVNNLAVQAGRNRAEQEIQLVQTRFIDYRRDALDAAKSLLNIVDIAGALGRGAETSDIRSMVWVASNQKVLDNVTVIDANGAFVTSVEKTGSEELLARSEALVGLAMDGNDVSTVIYDEGDQSVWVVAAVPLRDILGELIGAVLVGDVIDDFFLQEINLFRDDVHLALISDELIVAQDFPHKDVLNEFSDEIITTYYSDQVTPGEGVVIDELVRSQDGDPYVLAYSPLADVAASVGIMVDMSELSAFQSRLLTVTFIVLLVLTLFTVLIVTWFARTNITQRINSLRFVTDRISRGDFEQLADATSRDEVGELAVAFNRMAFRLRNTLEQLEERSLQLQISNEVSRRLSVILDQDELVKEVVDQVQVAFDYYHAHIYLLDDDKKNLLMVGGTGEAGQAMLERGHKIPLDSGLVGRAGSTNMVILVPDVSQEDGWLPNPLLPETKAEVAVPISVGDEVLGVLDVQDDKVGGLSNADADLLQAIAGQVAIALQNARAYDAAQKQAQREALIGEISQRIQSTTSVEDALKVTVRELSLALKKDTFVQLMPEDDKTQVEDNELEKEFAS